MTSLFRFFSVYFPPKLNLPIAEQRKMWLVNFLKAFGVVLIAYMAMYLIRNNFKASSGMLKDQLGFTTTQLGQIGLAFSITYGIGKTLIGYFADGKNSKRLISALLILSALTVLIMGIILSTHGHAMGFLLLLWGLNGLFQSAGGPISYATITKWAPRSQRGRWLGGWNTSHNIGGAIAGIIALWGANLLFAGHVYGMFIFPALIALGIGIATLFIGHDSPEEMGMERSEILFGEPIVKEDLDATELRKWKVFTTYILFNKWIWLLCAANIFVYVVRIGVDNWAPLYTKEMFNFTPSQQVNTIFYFEMGALIASLTWGYISDLMGGRPALVAALCLLVTFVGVWGYHHSSSPLTVNLFLVLLGSLIFGPQLLINVSTICFVPKKAITVTSGTSGTFGYLFGDSMAKIGLAVIADPKSTGLTIFGHLLHGWNATFEVLYLAIACGVILLGIVAYEENRKNKKCLCNTKI
ncbi:hexose-6-phosphate:phosphate antiporter [Gammaproteobacteria bacterium]